MRSPAVISLIVLLLGGIVTAEDNQLTEQEKKAGWILLFDGKTLDGWITSDQKQSQREVEQESINPHRVVPVGPVIDWDEPHGRG